MSSAVRLAPITPARMAVSNTGPLRVRWPAAARALATGAGSHTRACASATRWVTALPPTPTMVGRDAASRCVSAPAAGRAARAGRARGMSTAEIVHFGVMHAAGAQRVAQLAVAVHAPLPDGAHQCLELLVGGA